MARCSRWPAIAFVVAWKVALADPAAGSAPAPSSAPLPPLHLAESCASEPLRTSGTVHFACDCAPGADPKCVPGDDRNAGTSASAPLRSYLAMVSRFRSMGSGDTVAFCKGGRWEIPEVGGGRWVNARCRPDRTCDVRDYAAPWGNGSEARPILAQLGSTHLFNLHEGADARPEAGYRFLNLELRGSGRNEGFFAYGDVKDVLVCNMVIRGFDAGVDLNGSPPPAPGSGSDGLNARIIVRGNRFLENASQGVIGGCDGCVVEGNLFDGNGGPQGTMFKHSIYALSPRQGGTELPPTVRNMRIARNTILRSSRREGGCVGVALVVHGRHQGLVIEGNVIEEPAGTAASTCFGISLGHGGYPYGCWFRDAIVRGNVVRNMGAVGIGVGQCPRCVLENNVVVSDQVATGIHTSVDARREQPGDDPSTSVTVRNNTIYLGRRARGGTGVLLAPEGTGHVVVNNAIAFEGSGGGDGWSCVDVRPPRGALARLDHNLCWFPRAPTSGYGAASWQGAAGRPGQSLDAWRSSSGLDVHSVQRDPMFVQAPDDLTPGPGSPLLGAADPAQSPAFDATGKRRGSAPDIGAFQR